MQRGRHLLAVIVLLCSVKLLTAQEIVVDTLTVSRFGRVYLYSAAKEKPEHLIIMISGDAGWKFGVPEFAREFTGKGSVVAGVDILRYYHELRKRAGECLMVTEDYDGLASAIESKYGFEQYVPPVLMGYSSGATLVYALLAQARPGTYLGGISLGFCPDIGIPGMLCEINGLKTRELVKGKSYLLLPDSSLHNPWVVLHGKADKICDIRTISQFVEKTSDSKLIVLPDVTHGFSRWADFMPQWKTAYNDLLNKYSRSMGPGSNQVPAFSGIPYIVPGNGIPSGKNLIALFYSGDGGWYGFEKIITDRLNNIGIPVIGIDLKKYLWNRITPDKAARDAAGLLEYFGSRLNKTEYLIIGYSQGAEIVPFVFNRLPEEIRNNVKSLVMLSPEETTDFKIHLTYMMGMGSKEGAFNVINEIARIRDPKQVIIFGDTEKTTVPALLKNADVEIIKVPGDHHFNKDYGLIVNKLKESHVF